MKLPNEIDPNENINYAGPFKNLGGLINFLKRKSVDILIFALFFLNASK
jgi:hypothetical protein